MELQLDIDGSDLSGEVVLLAYTGGDVVASNGNTVSYSPSYGGETRVVGW